MGRVWSALVLSVLGGCGADSVRETVFSTVLDPADDETRAELRALRVELRDAGEQTCAALSAYRVSCGGACAADPVPGAGVAPVAEQLVRKTEAGWPRVTLDPPDRPLEVVVFGLDATDASFLYGCRPVELRQPETVIPLRRRWCDERACDACSERVDCAAAAEEPGDDPGPPACEATGSARCDGVCIDLAGGDPANCGACGRRCTGADRCCGGECIDTDADEQHCGACDVPCAASERCCGGECVDPATDDSNCGDCGTVCAEPAVCAGGECVFCLFSCGLNPCGSFGRRCQACDDLERCACGEGAFCAEGACCSGACVDVRSDPDHCGACEVQCVDGESCVDGKCPCAGGERCPGTENCCNGACTDTTSDPRNCGGCGQDCGEQGCVGGACQ